MPDTTERLYLADSYLREFDATVIACADGWCALSRSAFHPGGGGQPPDEGSLDCHGEVLSVTNVREDEHGLLWHEVGTAWAVGASVRGYLAWERRYGLMRHHCLLHVVNAIGWQRYGGRVTGAEIGADRARVDLSLAGFTRDHVSDFEVAVNAVIARALPVTASLVPEATLDTRPDLVRTLNVRPPVTDGRVRIVEIDGFDAQACGGTHVHSTGDIGAARIVKFDNRGKDNKRFYWELVATAAPPAQPGT